MIITKAAIMFADGDTVEGRSYGIISTLASRLGYGGEKVHGFVTSSGEFVLPDKAAEIALLAGQVSEPVESLAPEDLWPEANI